jgi:hypothetical protein
LGTSDEDNAVEMLLDTVKRRRCTGKNNSITSDTAACVVKRLGHLPFAINTAANYTASADVDSLKDFIVDYEQNELDFVTFAMGNQEQGHEAADLELVNRDI